jgi:hypothetical protein
MVHAAHTAAGLTQPQCVFGPAKHRASCCDSCQLLLHCQIAAAIAYVATSLAAAAAAAAVAAPLLQWLLQQLVARHRYRQLLLLLLLHLTQQILLRVPWSCHLPPAPLLPSLLLQLPASCGAPASSKPHNAARKCQRFDWNG